MSARWGWHRLDPAVAERLVADAPLPARSLVLDIGAGDGVVTAALVAAGHRVVAVELHPERLARLRRRFEHTDVVVVRADAAELRLPRRPYHVVANPPFAVNAAILRRLLQPGTRLVSARLVLPEWVTRRWASPDAPAVARWGTRFVASVGPSVPRRAFAPPPPRSARVLHIDERAGRRRRRQPFPGTTRPDS